MNEVTAGLDPEEVRKQAEAEVAAEVFREAVDRAKERLRLRRQFWIRLFPWRLWIERRDDPTNPRNRVLVQNEYYCKKCRHYNCTPQFCRRVRKDSYDRYLES